MSQQSGPDEPPPPNHGNSTPPPNWTPAPLSAAGDASYADKAEGQRPVDSPNPNASAIAGYAPKKALLPILVGLAGVLVAALIAYTAIRPPAPTESPSPSPSHPTSASATPRDGTRFTVGTTDTSGTWKITDSRWTKRGLDLLIRVRVETGSLECYFNALSNSGQTIVRNEATLLTPVFPADEIEPGESVSGWVFLPIERGTTLVFLRTTEQPQVSGIEVSG